MGPRGLRRLTINLKKEYPHRRLLYMQLARDCDVRNSITTMRRALANAGHHKVQSLRDIINRSNYNARDEICSIWAGIRMIGIRIYARTKAHS